MSEQVKPAPKVYQANVFWDRQDCATLSAQVYLASDADSYIDALHAEAEALREERDSFQREGIRAMEDLEAARGLLREIRPMIAKSPVSDWFARRDALLTATPAQEVTAGGPYASLAEALAQRYPKPSLLKDCNVTYSNSSRPLADQGERQEADERDALRASLPVGVPEGAIYVEYRQCDQCQHGGINDAAAGLAACHDCDWTGREPVEDKCPGCQSEDCMAAACPKCGSRYVLVASEDIAAPAAPAVKAEQVQCDTCHGQGEICVGQQTFGYMSMQPPEPIMEVCPECGGEEAPSLPAAGAAGEEVEVVAFLMEPDLYEPYVSLSRDSRCDHLEPLMTVAQHERIVAALAHRQAQRKGGQP